MGVQGAPEAASSGIRDTRRQLLEQALVFRTRRVLLVDVPGRTIRCVVCPALR